MAKKKKADLTLEELQAKKAKTQRGWVRFCAIVLAVALTAAMYGVASKGGPKKVPVYPNTVQTVVNNGGTSTDDTTTPSTNTTTPSTGTSTDTSSDEGGGILDSILGMLGGIDLGSIAGKLDLNGLGVAAVGGIQTAKESLLAFVDQLEASITGKPTISHDAEEYPFADGTNVGSQADRQAIVDLLNKGTAQINNFKEAYSFTRSAQYTDDGHASIGAQTDTINQLLGSLGNGMTLDTVVGEFNGANAAVAASVPAGQTADDLVTAGTLNAATKNYALMTTQLTADDIQIVNQSPITGTYTILLKNVDNPNRRADCGLTRFTNDYLVQNEVADSIKNSLALNQASFEILKLTDLEMKYSNIAVTFQVDPLTGALKTLSYQYQAYSKFTVRTNTVQIIGAATTQTVNTYTF